MRVGTGLLLAVTLGASTFLGCTDAERSRFKGYGDESRIVLYSGGKAIRCWESTGRVKVRNSSDRVEFVDAATTKFVSVTGTMAVELEKSCEDVSLP